MGPSCKQTSPNNCLLLLQDEELQTESGQQEQQLQRLQLDEGMQTEVPVLSRPHTAPPSKSPKAKLDMGRCHSFTCGEFISVMVWPAFQCVETAGDRNPPLTAAPDYKSSINIVVVLTARS